MFSRNEKADSGKNGPAVANNRAGGPDAQCAAQTLAAAQPGVARSRPSGAAVAWPKRGPAALHGPTTRHRQPSRHGDNNFCEMALCAFPNRIEVHEHYSNQSRICSKDPT